MTANHPHIEALGEHNYLIRVRADEQTVEVRVHASPEVVARIGVDDTEENRIVEATAAYLIQRQRADDLPATLDLDDVAAAYSDYITDMSSLLGGR